MNNILIIILNVMLFIILGVIVWRNAQKHAPADYEALRRLPKSPLLKSYFLTGLLWLGIGIFNLVMASKLHASHHNATSQELFGPFALAMGGYWIGLSAPRRLPTGKTKK
jgi:hypothetical protein